MDGTGDLFAPFTTALTGHAFQIVPLPTTGDQNPVALATRLRAFLPRDPFVLVAESFSGPIGATLAYDPPPGMRGIVFVATFLSPPRGALLASALPIGTALAFPGFPALASRLALGRSADATMVKRLDLTIRGLGGDLMRARLRALGGLRAAGRSELPALYLRATADWLVPRSKVADFEDAFPRLRVEDVDGTHFLLQTSPRPCAALIEAFAAECMSGPHATPG